jgi:hypothetical protein
MIIYTDRLLRRGYAGATYCTPIIFIRPSHRGDVGLLEHEKVHVKQFWRSFGLMGLFYALNKKKRFQYEAEAYRKQLEFDPQKLDLYAGFLATKYKLGITHEQALEALKAAG